MMFFPTVTSRVTPNSYGCFDDKLYRGFLSFVKRTMNVTIEQTKIGLIGTSHTSLNKGFIV